MVAARVASVLNLATRRGGPEDEDAILGLFDEAVEWMVARGQVGQWGSERPSQTDDWRARVHRTATGSELYVLELEDRVVGVLAVGAAPSYLPSATAPELYIELVLTSRAHAGQGLGSELVAIAERIARERSATMLRVDCWAEAPSLVGWYEAQGFSRCGTFEVRGWSGQILARSVPASTQAEVARPA